jgi:predicted Na+-dependent transporter
MGLNTIVFPESAGADSSVGAKMALISNVAGLFTIPLMLSLLG